MLIATICALALIAGVTIASLAFERLPHLEDEVAYLFQARTLALGRLTVPTPQHADAFWLPFVLDYQGQRFGKYPPGWPAVLALGELAGAPWLVNPVLAALALYLVYRLGRTLYDTRTGLLAAALGLTSPLLLVLSGSHLSHLASMVLLLAFTLGFVRVARGSRSDKPRLSEKPGLSERWYAIGSGIALGLAFLSRSLTAVGYATPFIMYSLFQVIVRRQRHWPNYLLIALAGGAVAALLPLYQWAVTGDPWLNPYLLWWPYDKIGFGPGIGWMPGGHSWHYAWLNLKQDLANAATDVLGWPGLSWTPIALALALPGRRRRDWLLLTPFAGLVVAYLFYWIGSPMRLWGPRYYFEGFGGLWILAAVGLWRVWDWLKGAPDCRAEQADGSALATARRQRSSHAGVGATAHENMAEHPERSTAVRSRRVRSGLPPKAASFDYAARTNALPRSRCSVSIFGTRISLAVLALLLVINLGVNLPPRLAQAKGFYGISQEQLRPIQEADIHNALVFVTVERWLEYGALLVQMGPLLDDDVLYPRSLGPEADAVVMRDYPERTVYYLMNGVLKKAEK